MSQNRGLVPLFVSDRGVSYRLFIHSCPEKEKVADLIEVSKRSLELCIILIEGHDCKCL